LLAHLTKLPYKNLMRWTMRREILDGRSWHVWAVLSVLLVSAVCATSALVRAQGANNPGRGLPPVVAPTDNPQTPARIALGRRLFFDPRLSRNGSISCSSCHQPEHAFSDGRSLAQGIDKREGTRNTPSLLNVAFNISQFWDGRRTLLEAQALDPLTNPLEHGLKDTQALLAIIRANPSYVTEFRAAFPANRISIQASQVAQAIACFERTLIAGDSPFDRYFFGRDERALSPSAQRGLTLFQHSAHCSSCHTIGLTEALFADNAFHSLSIGLQRIAPRLPELTKRVVAARQSGISIDRVILSDRDIAELGRFAVTLNPADIGNFRTPSLRNVELTAPYMHDGSVATLQEAVDRELYYRGNLIGRPLILTPGEKSDLVEFLKALTSPNAPTIEGPPHLMGRQHQSRR
jgi:cytochrome c peroxidase